MISKIRIFRKIRLGYSNLCTLSLFVHLSLRLGSAEAEAKTCPRVEFNLMDLESVGNSLFDLISKMLWESCKTVILNKLVLRVYAQ